MKTPLLHACAIAALLLGSCAKDDHTAAEPEVLHFSGQVNRLQASSPLAAPAISWANDDAIGIFMVHQGSIDVAENGANRQYRFDGSVFAPTADQQLYYPVLDSKVEFIAYSPYRSGVALDTPVPVDVSQQKDQPKIDFLWAKATNGTTGFSKATGTNVPLTFDHILSKIVIKPTAGAGLDASTAEWKDMILSIKGMLTESSVDLATGELGTAANVADITPFVHTAGSNYEAIILPETYASPGDVKFTFTIAGDIYVWNSQADEIFEPGKEYTYTITVSKTGVTLDNITVKDWVSVPRSGTAR